MDRFEQSFWSGQSLEELYRIVVCASDAFDGGVVRCRHARVEAQPRRPGALVRRIADAYRESDGRDHRSARSRDWNSKLLVLATVGSAGPFVGLLGTVWGIMTSFRAIAGQQGIPRWRWSRPGIAEALFATAIGLIAAIPATIFYNKFVADVNKQAQRLEGFADEFSAILSRQIDDRRLEGRAWV